MIKRSIVCAALLATALSSNCLLAQPLFFRKDIPIGVGPTDVHAGDFNGDGRPDLVVIARDGVFILLNEGGGTFAPPISDPSSFPVFVVGDFNGDGKADISGIMGVRLSRGDGTFLPSRPIGNLFPPYAIQAGDFNRDGKLDLLVSRYGPWPPGAGPSQTAEQIRVWLGNGDGTFRPGHILANPAGGVNQAVVADFNHDGASDVAVLAIENLDSPLVASALVFLGQGDGTFGKAVRTRMDATGLFVADFNADGLPDLATVGCEFCAPGTTGVFLGRGDGSSQLPVPYPSWGERDFWLTAGDFNGDGTVDLVAGGSTNVVSIYPGKGDGAFGLPVLQPVAWFARSPAVVDLDGDGHLDLVTANDHSNTVSVLLAKTHGGPELRRAVSAASDTAIVAPGSLTTVFAPTTATAITSASLPWSTRLGGIGLDVRDSTGATRQAPLLFVSPTQINFQVPADTALGEATLALVTAGGSTPIGSMKVEAVAPGLFLVSHVGAVPAATAVRVEADGTQTPVEVFTCSGNSCKSEPIPLSAAGISPIYLSFFGTGFRGATPENVTCSISGVQVPVQYAGPQGTPGLDQINVRLLPETLTLFGGEVIIRIDGVAANTGLIDVR